MLTATLQLKTLFFNAVKYLIDISKLNGRLFVYYPGHLKTNKTVDSMTVLEDLKSSKISSVFLHSGRLGGSSLHSPDIFPPPVVSLEEHAQLKG